MKMILNERLRFNRSFNDDTILLNFLTLDWEDPFEFDVMGSKEIILPPWMDAFLMILILDSHVLF